MVFAVTRVIGEKLRDGWQATVSAWYSVLSLLEWGWPLLLLLIGPTLVVVTVSFWESWKGRRLGRDVLRMAVRADAPTFASLLGVLFTRLGYQVETLRRLGDFSVDLVIVGDGLRLVVQAGRQRGRAAAQYIHEVAAAKAFYHC